MDSGPENADVATFSGPEARIDRIRGLRAYRTQAPESSNT